MGLLIFSKIFGTILLMSWINQAFIVKHNTWVRRITIKNSLISIVFTKEVGKKPSKNYCKKMYEYSKWSPDNFTLDFGSIETISIHQNIFKTTFCLVFLNPAILAKCDFFWSKHRFHSDMKSDISMKFKNMQNKILVHMKIIFGL